MTFESEGLFIVATYLHMVAAGELCCLSDNSGHNSRLNLIGPNNVLITKDSKSAWPLPASILRASE